MSVVRPLSRTFAPLTLTFQHTRRRRLSPAVCDLPMEGGGASIPHRLFLEPEAKRCSSLGACNLRLRLLPSELEVVLDSPK